MSNYSLGIRLFGFLVQDNSDSGQLNRFQMNTCIYKCYFLHFTL